MHQRPPEGAILPCNGGHCGGPAPHKRSCRGRRAAKGKGRELRGASVSVAARARKTCASSRSGEDPAECSTTRGHRHMATPSVCSSASPPPQGAQRHMRPRARGWTREPVHEDARRRSDLDLLRRLLRRDRLRKGRRRDFGLLGRRGELPRLPAAEAVVAEEAEAASDEEREAEAEAQAHHDAEAHRLEILRLLDVVAPHVLGGEVEDVGAGLRGLGVVQNELPPAVGARHGARDDVEALQLKVHPAILADGPLDLDVREEDLHVNVNVEVVLQVERHLLLAERHLHGAAENFRRRCDQEVGLDLARGSRRELRSWYPGYVAHRVPVLAHVDAAGLGACEPHPVGVRVRADRHGNQLEVHALEQDRHVEPHPLDHWHLDLALDVAVHRGEPMVQGGSEGADDQQQQTDDQRGHTATEPPARAPGGAGLLT
mmetsp:Transcript_79817/g.224006  ORF Transcript_79817/g.224006 Transcript_79817/m.224006 type:complete len:430 (-) Transcript_79817:122-1411(-)